MSGGLVEAGGVSLSEAKATISMAFQRGLQEEVATQGAMFTTFVGSEGASTKYPMLGQMTGAREWVGPREYEDLTRHAYELKNRTFEKSLEVPVDALEDDQLDGYALNAEQLGEQARLWPDDLIFEALLAGGSRLCFDQQFFFDTDHPIDPGNPASSTYANLFTGSALTSSNFANVLKQMQQIVGRDGRPRGFGRGGRVVLAVPPGLREVGKQIVEAEYLANGATNTNKNAAELVVVDRLYNPAVASTATSWFLFDLGRKLKPILFQERKAPKLVAMIAENTTNVFELDMLRWGMKMRGAAGYTLPYLAARSDA